MSSVHLRDALLTLQSHGALVPGVDGKDAVKAPTSNDLAALANDPRTPPKLRAACQLFLNAPGLLEAALADGVDGAEGLFADGFAARAPRLVARAPRAIDVDEGRASDPPALLEAEASAGVDPATFHAVAHAGEGGVYDPDAQQGLFDRTQLALPSDDLAEPPIEDGLDRA